MGSLLRWVGVIVVAALSGATGLFVVLMVVGLIRGPATRAAAPIDVSYADFLAVTLTAVTVVLGSLAIGIAVLAMRTIKEIKDDARQAATETVNATTSSEVTICLEQMLATGKLDAIVEKTFLGRSNLSIRANRELQPDFDPEDSGER